MNEEEEVKTNEQLFLWESLAGAAPFVFRPKPVKRAAVKEPATMKIPSGEMLVSSHQLTVAFIVTGVLAFVAGTSFGILIRGFLRRKQ